MTAVALTAGPRTPIRPAPPPDWPSLMARVAAGERVVDVAGDAGVTRQALAARCAVARKQARAAAAWTPADDLALAEALTAGRGLTGAAAALRRAAEDCLARWRELMPEPGVDAQTRLLRRLRAAGG